MRAVLRQARISRKKANLVAAMVRGMTVTGALATLERLPKKGAQFLHALISSAVANAEQTAGQKPDDLFLRTLTVTKGPSLKRFIPIARGRARPIDKATSHITVELGVVIPEGGVRAGAGAGAGEKGGRKNKETKETRETKETGETGEMGEYVPTETGKSPRMPVFDASADPHGRGAKWDGSERRDRKGPSFQPHRRGGRGL